MRPLIGDRADLGFGIADVAQVAERDLGQAVAGRADLAIDLEAALELLPVEAAERPFEREAHVVARREMVSRLGRLLGRTGDIAVGAVAESPQHDEGEDEPDEDAQTANHLSYVPL